jgi:hypothetical protein
MRCSYSALTPTNGLPGDQLYSVLTHCSYSGYALQTGYPVTYSVLIRCSFSVLVRHKQVIFSGLLHL